jgi:protein TonB
MKNQLLILFTIVCAFVITTTTHNGFAENGSWNSSAISPDDSSKVYDVVDEMPEIVGGYPALFKEIEYPAVAMANNVEGRVFIQFTVDENGNVLNPKILKDIGSGCGDAAIAALRKVEFKPGKLNGKPVKVNFAMPVNFKIQ